MVTYSVQVRSSEGVRNGHQLFYHDDFPTLLTAQIEALGIRTQDSRNGGILHSSTGGIGRDQRLLLFSKGQQKAPFPMALL